MQTAPPESTCSISGTLWPLTGLSTTATMQGAKENRVRSFSRRTAEASGTAFCTRSIRTSPIRARASPSIRMKRQGLRRPWSGTCTASARSDSRHRRSGPGAAKCLQGVEILEIKGNVEVIMNSLSPVSLYCLAECDRVHRPCRRVPL